MDDKETIRRMLRVAENGGDGKIVLNMFKTALAAELEMSDDIGPHSASDILEEVEKLKRLVRRYEGITCE